MGKNWKFWKQEVPDFGARKRVAAGAALLDERWPGWWNEIDTRKLAIHDGRFCVVGQLYGGYTRGIISLLGLTSSFGAPSEMGFNMTLHAEQMKEAAALHREWLAAIAERKASGSMAARTRIVC